MSLSESVREKIVDFLTSIICEDEDFGFCSSCPELREEEDIGCLDCPYGLAVDSCEYFPQKEIDEFADEIVAKFEECRP